MERERSDSEIQILKEAHKSVSDYLNYLNLRLPLRRKRERERPRLHDVFKYWLGAEREIGSVEELEQKRI